MRAFQQRKSAAFFLVLSLPATAMGFALSVQISLLSWLLATRYGLKIDEIGLVWAAGPLAGILAQVAIGGLSDRAWLWGGRRRAFIILGGLLAAVSLLLLPQIGVLSHALGLKAVFGVAVTVALALDLAVNVGFNPTRALIADVTAEGEERTRGYSWMQVISGGFGVAAYAIGALFGNLALIYVAVGLVTLFAVAPSLLITEPRGLAAPSAEAPGPATLSLGGMIESLSPLWALLVYDVAALGARAFGAAPIGFGGEALCAAATLLLIARAFIGRQDARSPFRKTVAASALCWLGIQPIFVYMVSFLQVRMPTLDADALGRTTGWAFLVLNGVAALSPLLLGRLARRHGAIVVHVAAVASMGLGCLAIWRLADSPPRLYLLMALCGVGWGSVVSLPFVILSQSVARAQMGLFMGLFNLSVVLPQLVASLGVGSFVAAVDDKGLVFALSGGFLLASAALWRLVGRDRLS